MSRPVTQIMRHDPGVRLGEDPEDVYQFRVAIRRLRSDLRAFASLLDPQPVSEVRDGLRLLGARAGAARDTDVLTGRLRAKAGQLPQQDAAGVEELIRCLDSRSRAARAALLDALRSPAYDQLLDALVGIAREPPIAAEPRGLAGRPAAGVVPGLVRRPWRRLKRAAQALRSNSPDAEWHVVRIRAKRCATPPRLWHRSAAAGPGGSPRPSRQRRPSSGITRTRSSPRHGYATPPQSCLRHALLPVN
jgi:CHAD domain-containing protein